MSDNDQRKRQPTEDPYDRARRQGREAKDRDGDWRDNPYLPGTRQWYEFDDGLKVRN